MKINSIASDVVNTSRSFQKLSFFPANSCLLFRLRTLQFLTAKTQTALKELFCGVEKRKSRNVGKTATKKINFSLLTHTTCKSFMLPTLHFAMSYLSNFPSSPTVTCTLFSLQLCWRIVAPSRLICILFSLICEKGRRKSFRCRKKFCSPFSTCNCRKKLQTKNFIAIEKEDFILFNVSNKCIFS